MLHDLRIVQYTKVKMYRYIIYILLIHNLVNIVFHQSEMLVIDKDLYSRGNGINTVDCPTILTIFVLTKRYVGRLVIFIMFFNLFYVVINFLLTGKSEIYQIVNKNSSHS